MTITHWQERTATLARSIPRERIHLPDTPEYDHAVSLWNGAVARRPALVVAAQSRQDVEAAVQFARDTSTPISVRGGGHDWAGRSLNDDGITIDTSRMRGVTVDPAARVAILGAGATAADVVAAGEPRGLVAATGTVGQVGIVGLTLGGGYGPLNGRVGLALDNVLGFQVVGENGSMLTVDAHREPDLFWALRGGGGNFGVVTSMAVRLHPISSVTAGVIMYPWQQAADVMRAYGELVPVMPDQLTVQTGILSGPDGQPVFFLTPVWSGADDPSEWLLRLGGLGTPVAVDLKPMAYSALLTQFDPFIAWGRHYELRTRTLRSFTPGVIEALTHAGDMRTSPSSAIAIHHCHGASTRVPIEDTAFGIREPHFVVEIIAAWEPGDDPAPHRAWADTVYRELAPHAIEGGYPNLIGPEQAAQARNAYGPNATRLIDVKRRYDPDNVFAATSLPLSR